MLEHRFTRRTALKTAAAALPLGVASGTLLQETNAQQSATEAPQLVVGMATTGFREYTNHRLAEELAKRSVHTVQLFLTQTDSNYWRYNSRNDLSDLTPARCREIADVYRSAGISIHSVGVYTNLIHPDEDERKANLAYFEAMMKVARHMGVRTLVTEAGHYHGEGAESAVPHYFQEEVWTTMVATGKQLAALAKSYGATVLVEPFYRGFFATAKRTRLFLEAVDSPHIRVLLDPANLLELNDLEEMFDQLAPWVDCLHAKDRKLHVSRGVPAGQGDLDYRKFVALAAARTPKAPLIMEYVGSADYDQALAHLRYTLREVGLRYQ